MLQALADATRRDIVSVVMASERSVSELAERYPMSFAAVQKHVAVLERAGLVTKRRSGREQRVSGNIDAIHAVQYAMNHLEAIWRGRLERAGDILREQNEGVSP